MNHFYISFKFSQTRCHGLEVRNKQWVLEGHLFKAMHVKNQQSQTLKLKWQHLRGSLEGKTATWRYSPRREGDSFFNTPFHLSPPPPPFLSSTTSQSKVGVGEGKEMKVLLGNFVLLLFLFHQEQEVC